MPQKSRKLKLVESKLEKVRESKKKCNSVGFSTNSAETGNNSAGSSANSVSIVSYGQPAYLEELLAMSDDALNTESEDVDPTFDLDESMKSDTSHLVESFCEEFVAHLELETELCLDSSCIFSSIRYSAKAGRMLHSWVELWWENQIALFVIEEIISLKMMGRFQRASKGTINIPMFYRKVNYRIYPEKSSCDGEAKPYRWSVLSMGKGRTSPKLNFEPGFSQKISVETSPRWVHELEFQVVRLDCGWTEER